ncbi:MAG TPA: ELM1/GtrOC1 family putative glycosyltransferase [Hyphomicrobiaceae bacterium]|nr:ELM1/GtrOC1 family putative glycosyltransferase [Hyphomicrobiaceae bacterium]
MTASSGSQPLSPLKALLLSDGRPGHYHLAEGIIAAVVHRHPVETVRLEIRRRRWMPGRVLAALMGAGAGPAALLRLGYGLSSRSLPAAGLVVSAGGDTLAANIGAAKVLAVPNIFYGSVRRFSPEDFALVLTSHARHGERARHVRTLKPSPADPDAMPPLAPAARGGQKLAVAGLLVGGDTTTIRYTSGDWERLVAFLRAMSAAAGTRWIVSNSRRTPPMASAALSRLAAEPESPVLRFIDVGSAGAGTLGELFARSEAILCTVDSSSMVSEAVWLRRPVLAIAPAEAALPANEQEYRDYLETNGWTRSLAIADLTPAIVLDELGRVTPLASNPLDLLAATLKEKLPQLFPDAPSA